MTNCPYSLLLLPRMPLLPHALFRSAALIVFVAAMLLVFTSCTFLRSGSTDRVTPSTLVAQRIPASPVSVPHPDAVRADRGSYFQQQMDWSVRYRTPFVDRSFESDVHTTFATLWSQELVEAELIHEIGITDLSDDLAERLRTQELLQYERLVRFRVHMFVDRRAPEAAFSTDLRPPRVDIQLRAANGERYRPTRTRSGGIETYQQTSSSPVMLYRVNDLYFERVDGDDDILDTDDLQLRVRYPANPLGDLYFEWDFAD